MSEPIPIADQAAEAQREVDFRVRVYPNMVMTGRMKQADADRHLARMRAATATLKLMMVHADGLRELIKFLRANPSYNPDEAKMLMQHEAVRTMLASFPEAVLTSVKPVVIPPPDNKQDTLL